MSQLFSLTPHSQLVSRRRALGVALTGVLAGSLALETSSQARAASVLRFGEGKISGGASTIRSANKYWRSVKPLQLGDTTTSWDALPFHQFQVPAEPGQKAHLAWEGKTNPRSRVRMLVWDATSQKLQEVAAVLSSANGSAKISASVPVSSHVEGGKIRVIIQHSVGFSGANLSSRSTPVTPEHPADTPRSQYDFTLAWESDTQYYNESFPERQLDIHNYLLRQRAPMNIQYLFHTGDIVDEYLQPIQWQRTNKAYAMLDQAEFPYGVLGGNHDVGQKDDKGFPYYTQHFGASRFQKNPWYGGSHKNNRGHYDLISAGGHDFIMVYMSWSAKDEEIAWMNQVLASFPERTAILALHEYLNIDGSRGPLPQRIKNEVVAKNPNVRMVLSGHYHGSFKSQDFFDDNGDGRAERVVTNLLFDAQGLPEGGQAFTRLMHFDNQNRRMIARAYSPYLKKHTTDHRAFPKDSQEFTLTYDELGLKSQVKTLSTSSFSAQFS